MTNITSQSTLLRPALLQVLEEVVESGQFIQGSQVHQLEKELSQYLGTRHTISCGSGTAALQVILMSLGLNSGDEIIIPAFTYASVAEAACLLGLKIIPVDVNWDTFNIDPAKIEIAITSKTKAIIAVHLFGQCADMATILRIAKDRGLYVIEDAAQNFGATYNLDDEIVQSAGTMGDINYTSFFPTKNLGCYGDGGAIFTNDPALASKARMITKHGQSKKYHHDYIGINSRLDTIQAAILLVKMLHLDQEIERCQEVASVYSNELSALGFIDLPITDKRTTHTFHQYVLKVKDRKRDLLKDFLKEKNIPSAIYYPLPIYKQTAFVNFCVNTDHCEIAEKLCEDVLAIPIHSEMTSDQVEYICDTIKLFGRDV